MPLDDDTFLRAILEAPGEEANWLVYADWLEERGDGRAALYRRPRLTNSVGMELALVPRGTAEIGPGPSGEHRAEIAQELYLSVGPVTPRQWLAVMGRAPGYTPPSRGEEREIVTYMEAWDFITALSRRERGLGGGTYRLPTWEEWQA